MFKNEYTSDPWKRAEHEAVRNSVGWYYYTHQLLEVTGEDATAFLDKIYVNTIAKTKIGREKYTTMLNEVGEIIDDVIVFRLEENKYWISTLYLPKLIDWLDDHVGSYQVEYEDITADMDMYAVQGPKSRDLLNSFLAEKLDDQKFFTIRDNMIDDIPIKVARSGYTGELGYEVYIAPEYDQMLEEKLTKYGKKFDAKHVTELQVMVLTLATEKGYNLMTDLGRINLFESEPDYAVDWSKDFIGKAALEKIKEEGPKRQLVGFTVEDETAHIACKNKGGSGEAVMLNGQEVGRVMKYTYGYTVEKCIGFALIDKSKAKIGDKVTINGAEATLTDRIWYDVENNRPFGR